MPTKFFDTEFEEFPEKGNYNFDWYEKDNHLIIYCKECNVYKCSGYTDSC